MSKKAYINWKQIQAAQAKLKASVEADPWQLVITKCLKQAG